MQQSIFDWSLGMSGISPPDMVHSGMLVAGCTAPLAATGANASPSAQSIESSSLITRVRIGGES